MGKTCTRHIQDTLYKTHKPHFCLMWRQVFQMCQRMPLYMVKFAFSHDKAGP